MGTYVYPNKTTLPDLGTIHTDVTASTMVDKALNGCTWDEGTQDLNVVFINILSGADKVKLDTIVTDNS